MPKFSPGDIIKDRLMNVKVISIHQLRAYLLPEYELEVISSSDPRHIGMKLLSRCAFIDSHWTLVAKATVSHVVDTYDLQQALLNVKNQAAEALRTHLVAKMQKPCTCDSFDLSRKGCQCGAVAKRKWGLGS